MATWILSRKVFALRSLIFFTALLLTLISRDFAREIFFFPLIGLLMVYHLIWAFAMIEMFLALLPGLNHFIGRGKVYRHNYIPQCYNQNELKLQTRLFDRRAFSAALVWLTALISIGLFRLEHCWVIMISFLFYYLDQLFVNVWCPFQNWIIRNRCCATCRIYSWGFSIIVSPLIYIRSFWTYSLVAVGAVLLIQWEFLHYKYPERFSELSNAALSCKHCNDRCAKIVCSPEESAKKSAG